MEMNLLLTSLFFFLFFQSYSALPLEADQCDPTSKWDSRTLRSDQITVLINGFSESRIPLLQSIAAAYSASPIVSAVLVLWGNPETPTKTLEQLGRNLTLSPFGSATVSVIRQPSSSLNARFLPRPSHVKTRAVLICDDDVEIDSKSFGFAFRIWGANPDHLIGIFARSHDIDLSRKEWIYTVHPDRYSIVLTKFMILKTEYLFQYSCGGGSAMERMRKVVDRMRNCEDILMNFVVADGVKAGPILVAAERARDWGDARNDDHENGRRGLVGEVARVGLSSRKGEHRKRRGECLMEFHRLMGKMPLRYSYGKLVHSVGEQGLCRKGGKLVFCDQ